MVKNTRIEVIVEKGHMESSEYNPGGLPFLKRLWTRSKPMQKQDKGKGREIELVHFEDGDSVKSTLREKLEDTLHEVLSKHPDRE